MRGLNSIYRCSNPKPMVPNPLLLNQARPQLIELRRPHLVLSDTHGNVSVHIGSDIAECLDCVLLQNTVEALIVLSDTSL